MRSALREERCLPGGRVDLELLHRRIEGPQKSRMSWSCAAGMMARSCSGVTSAPTTTHAQIRTTNSARCRFPAMLPIIRDASAGVRALLVFASGLLFRLRKYLRVLGETTPPAGA